MKKRDKVLTAVTLGAFCLAGGSIALADQPQWPDQVKCYGATSCSGQSSCKSCSNSCKGKNSCSGQGFIMTDKKTCEEEHGSLTDTNCGEPKK